MANSVKLRKAEAIDLQPQTRAEGEALAATVKSYAISVGMLLIGAAMSVMRRRRLERLERLVLKKSEPWRDPYDLCMSLLAELDAEAARRPFSWIPGPGVKLSPEGEERDCA